MNKVQNRSWAEAPGETGPAPGAIVASGFSHLLRTAASSPGSPASPPKAGEAPELQPLPPLLVLADSLEGSIPTPATSLSGLALAGRII